MSTIQDVAREAGVGLGTVSRVLSGSPNVAPATRQRIEAAMARLDYRPSPAARALRRQRTDTLEIVVPLFTRDFYMEVLRGIEAALLDTDFSLVIRTVERAGDRERVFARVAERGGADGTLLVSLVPPPELLHRLRASAVCAVLIDGAVAELPSVAVDHAPVSVQAVQHLLALGHRRIALIDRREDPFAPVAVSGRQLGYRQALAAQGIAGPGEYEQVVDFNPEAGADALTRLLALPGRPTAIFAGSDILAISVIETARRQGLRVPEDLSVIGYNDIEVSHYLGLTTVRIPMREMGQRGAETLLELLQEPDLHPAHVSLAGQLVVRGTTGPVPV